MKSCKGMMKAARILFVLAIVFCALSLVLQGLLGMLFFASVESIALAFFSSLSVFAVGVFLLIVGYALDCAKNDSVHRLGIGLHVAGMALLTGLGVYLLLQPVLLTAVDGNTVDLSADSLLILVGAVLYAIAWFLVLLVHVARRGCEDGGCKEALQPEEDVHVAAIMKWKKLYNEGIITEREFIDKRNEILGLRK